MPYNWKIRMVKYYPSRFEQLDFRFHWIKLQKYLLKEIYDAYVTSENENWEIVSSPKDVMDYYSNNIDLQHLKYLVAISVIYQNGYWPEVSDAFTNSNRISEERKSEPKIEENQCDSNMFLHRARVDIDAEYEKDILMTEAMANQTYSSSICKINNWTNDII